VVDFALITAFMVAEVIGDLPTGSLALLAEARRMLSDSASLGLAFFAVWLAQDAADSLDGRIEDEDLNGMEE